MSAARQVPAVEKVVPNGVAGLRERNRARTRAEIRSHALRLFYERGYAATTMEQIAKAAEVSQSTLFRYFPTKEDLAMRDDFEERLSAALRQQPAGLSPIQAIRHAIGSGLGGQPADVIEREERHQRLIIDTPELHGRQVLELMSAGRMLAREIGRRVGRDADDFAVRNMAGAVLGVMMASVMTTLDDPSRRYLDEVDQGLAHLDAGLPLAWQALEPGAEPPPSPPDQRWVMRR